MNSVQKVQKKIHDSKFYNRFEMDLDKVGDLSKEVKFTFTVMDRKNALVFQQITGKFKLRKLLLHRKSCLCLKSN